MKARILEKKEIATGTLQVTYDLMGGDLSFKSGQYFFITLINPSFNDERGSRRHFSAITSPNQKGSISMATRITESAFKKSLLKLPVGTEVEVGPVAGVFTLPEDTSIPLVWISGGIGITPFMSMLRYIYEEKLPYKITLIYSNRNRASTVFLEELQTLEKSIPNFKLILSMTDDSEWGGEKRMVDANFIKEYLADINSYKYMVVGPPGMVSALWKALIEAGVSSGNIRKENFTGY